MKRERKTAPWSSGLRPVIDPASLPTPEAQTFPGESLLVRLANLVKLPHTVFALPFALVGVVYGSYADAVGVLDVVLVLIAFSAARFAAMGFNRIVDREMDARNPRTSGREIPTGRLTVGQAAVAVGVSSIVFMVAAGLLNRVCLALSPLALIWILAYSYAKRFTSWSHVWLGAALAIAPVGGYLAVTGSWSTPAWTLFALSGALMSWVAGFDIFYALQDEVFDRAHGVRSAVVALGERSSIAAARLMHGLAVVLLVAFGVGAQLGLVYYVGLAAAAASIVWEHRLLRPGDLSRLNAAFFTMNGVVSILFFLGTLVDRLL